MANPPNSFTNLATIPTKENDFKPVIQFVQHPPHLKIRFTATLAKRLINSISAARF